MNSVAKELLPRSWRTQKMHETYIAERMLDVANDSCPLCSAPALFEYTHWRIVKNIYPYDAVATVHDMLVTNRHVADDNDITPEEREELIFLKKTILNESYTFILEALPRNKSVPGHYHLHLIVPKIVT